MLLALTNRKACRFFPSFQYRRTSLRRATGLKRLEREAKGAATSRTDRRIRPLGLPTPDLSASPKGFQMNLIVRPATGGATKSIGVHEAITPEALSQNN